MRIILAAVTPFPIVILRLSTIVVRRFNVAAQPQAITFDARLKNIVRTGHGCLGQESVQSMNTIRKICLAALPLSTPQPILTTPLSFAPVPISSR